MRSLHRAALPALGAAFLFGASTPFAKQLMGSTPALASPFLLAGLLYLGSGLGLTLMRLLRDKGWKPSGIPRQDWPCGAWARRALAPISRPHRLSVPCCRLPYLASRPVQGSGPRLR